MVSSLHLDGIEANNIAVLGMTKADGIEYATQGIRINCVCPGYVRTNLNDGKGWDSEGVSYIYIELELEMY